MREPDPTEDAVDPWDTDWRRPETPPRAEEVDAMLGDALLAPPSTVTRPNSNRKPARMAHETKKAVAQPAPRVLTPDEQAAGVTQAEVRAREGVPQTYLENGDMNPEFLAYLRRGGTPRPPTPCDPIQLLSVDELATLPPLSWLIEGVLPARGLVMVHGHPGSAKSFLALDWSLTLACGLSRWNGRDTKPGRVVYVAAEAARGIHARVDAWQAHHRPERKPDIRFVPRPIRLRDPSTPAALLTAIRATGAPPALIVVDTFGKCHAGGDDNGSGDVSAALAHLDFIREETGATVAFLHHNVKGSTVERGSGVFQADVDVAVLITKADDGTRRLRCEKVRDGEPFTDMEFVVVPSEDSAVLVPSDGTTQSLEDRLVSLAKLEPGLNTTAIRARVGVRKETLLEALATCSRNRSLRVEVSGRERRVWPA